MLEGMSGPRVLSSGTRDPCMHAQGVIDNNDKGGTEGILSMHTRGVIGDNFHARGVMQLRSFLDSGASPSRR